MSATPPQAIHIANATLSNEGAGTSLLNNHPERKANPNAISITVNLFICTPP
jgi:hypothetical protein